MSFRDMGTSPSAPIYENSPPRNVWTACPPLEHPSPKSPIDQINEAIQHHKQAHNLLKEQSLISLSTTVPRYDNRSRLSAFSKLNDEIVHFQKMVNDLEKIADADIMTPGEQWRIRILLKSAEEVDVDLADQIQNSPWNKQKDLAVQSSFSKLKRDFARVHKLYRSVIQKHLEKQKAEMAFLSSRLEAERPNATKNVHRRSKVSVVEQEEDYFDRVVREREEETEDINTKLHTVNQIYEELSRIVNDQQEMVDMVEDQLRYARANAEVGLEHLQQRRSLMCGVRMEREQPPPVIKEDELHWTLPFHTFRHDVFEVQQDLVDLVHVSARKLKRLGSVKHFQCGPDTTVDASSVASQ